MLRQKCSISGVPILAIAALLLGFAASSATGSDDGGAIPANAVLIDIGVPADAQNLVRRQQNDPDGQLA